MANIINRSSMSGAFTPELIKDFIDRVKGESILAKLSNQVPVPFNGRREFTFSMDNEVDLVAESGKKSGADISFEPVTIIPVKVEYGARMSEEFLFATEEEQIELLKSFSEGFAKKVAKGLDLMAIHGVNPRTGALATTVIGNNCLDLAVQQSVTASGGTADSYMEAAIALVQGSDEDVTGAAISPAFRAALAALTANGVKVYPELAWGNAPSVINGLPVGISGNVSAFPYDDGTNTTTDLAYVGNFRDCFKWGYAKEIPTQIIEYGDPDNSGRDLKGYNEIYMRAETYLGWAILAPTAFAKVVDVVAD